MAKFADDSYIPVGSSKRHTIISEHDYVEDWAKKNNNLRLNAGETREIIIIKRGKVRPPPIQDMIRVKYMKIFGVTIRPTDDVHATNDVDNVITSCSHSMY